MDVPHVGSSTGVTNAKLGVWLFLASEVMLFSTLFTTYIVLRLGSSSWPRGWNVLNVPLGTLNTLVLITSSVTVVMAYAKAIERKRSQFRLFMSLTIALGVLFLILKGFEWGQHFHNGEFPSTSVFLAAYFTMTGLHALHVIGGLITNSILLGLSESQWDHPLFIGRVEAAGLYWHFVDIVWIFLFPALYLL
ncbi:MAG: heme-copper oxidase subunit III [Elusimicrobia bacterium]|nr:heme-copper oxidase subunit III [Elusimicrobiota bacterium]